MSGTADEDERRRRSLEAGREMLERYKAERLNKAQSSRTSQAEELSDEESLHNDKSMEHRGSCAHEGISSRDISHSSVSMSEGEGDGDLEGMAGRVAELEELLQGKEAIVEALNAEIDHLRAEASSPNSSQSQSSSIQGRDIISLYHTKLQEFERAVNQRDNLIEDLTSSLEQALTARDNLVAQLNTLNAMQISSSNAASNMNLQEKITDLETTLSDQKSIINKLNAQLAQIHEHVQTLEMEKETRNAEIDDYKIQINNLNEQIRLGAAEKNLNIAETLEQQKQYETRVDKIKQDMQHILEKFTSETNANAIRHQQEIKDLTVKHDSEITNIQLRYEEHLKLLKDENKVLADRLNKELPDLESRHAKELSIFQAQLAHYKKTVETLKLELVRRTETQKTAQAELNLYKSKLDELRVQSENTHRLQELNYQKEKEMLSEQIKLHKLQLEEITSKYVAATSVLESKESIERSLEQALTSAGVLKQENESLKFRLDDLSSRYSMAQSLIENNQAHERTLSTKIYDLEKSLSRVSGVNFSMLSDLNETAYQTFDDVAIQYHLTKQKLAEKADMEKLLIEKVHQLEEDTSKAKEELEQANLTKKSYEKQLKDMKNMVDKLKSEINTLKEERPNGENGHENNQELQRLKSLVEQRDSEIADYVEKLHELKEKMKRSEEETDQLKNGLAAAWAQCAEVEEKLNQTLAVNESRIDVSFPLSEYSDTLSKYFRLHRNANDSLNDTQDQPESIKSIDERNANLSETAITKLKEMEHVLGFRMSNEEMINNLHNYYTLSEKLSREKLELVEKMNSLQTSVNSLKNEKETLQKDMENLIEKHKDEISAVKIDTASEMKKMQSLLLSVKEGSVGISELKAELETRHAKEMEELRTYFEQKCLQMEKQYSEEIFSQQSKKMSDNDSEIEELTEDLYFGGAGDCLSVSNGETPVRDDNGKVDTVYESNMKILQQELERKIVEIQKLKEEFEKKFEEEKRMHEAQILNIKENYGRTMLLKAVNQHCQTEWDAGALENGELSQLRAAYNDQLEEQVAQAKLDIVNALQEQIQALLGLESDAEDNWPSELLELRDKLTTNAKREMQLIKEEHNAELARLKDEHTRSVARTIERHQEEINKLKTESASQSDTLRNSGITRERDRLNKTCATLKDLVGELIKYFTICEEEVNNVFINEILKKQLSGVVSTDKPAVEGQEQCSKGIESLDSSSVSELRIKRVHFAPQFNEIASFISNDNDSLQNLIDEDESITDKLKKELNMCLSRLKAESAEILGVRTSPDDGKLGALSSEMIWIGKINEELGTKLNQAEALIIGYQEESEQLKMKIIEMQQRLAIAESKKEIITEGYGEHDESGGDITVQDFSQLQEKARHVLSNGGGDCSYLLQLIEELSRQSDKMMDDAKKEKEDLQQQIEAADKQLRATRRFLEEQASEREAERDESARQIQYLQEQIKDREREKERDLRITSEPSLSCERTSDSPVPRTTDIHATVEALEYQMREMSSLMSDTEAKKSETETELKAAIDKIWVLRDIVKDLEQQLQTKTEKEESLQLQIEQLEAVVAAQTKNQQELVQELDAIKMGSENRQLTEHISQLEEELRKHKLSSEHFNVNSSALKQMKAELREMQNLLDKRIKDLESAHMCGSNLSLSQPSEDVSIREQIDASRCVTPEDPTAPPMLPLDQILKLKEKILKQARAEEVAFKRIKDLEMQLTALKNQNEELQAEQEILQQTASEQLFQIEAMRGRLEQHKQNAPFAQRQATSRLELQLHELNAKLQFFERSLADKELELRDTRNQLDRANQLLSEKGAEIANVVQLENLTIQKLRDRLEIVEEEKKLLQAKLGVQEHTQMELPQLIDSMLADKNDEIDHLKEQLMKKEKQLEIYSALPIDEAQLKELMRQTEAKNSARTLSDILSIHSECEDVCEAVRASTNSVQAIPHNVSTLKIPTISASPKNGLEVSVAPLIDTSKMSMQVPLLDLGSHTQSFSSVCYPELMHCEADSKIFYPETNANDSPANDANSSATKRKDASGSENGNRRSEQSAETSARVKNLESLLNDAREELRATSFTLEQREAELAALHKQYEEMQSELKESIEILTRDKNFYKNQYELSQASENKIKKDLEEVENTLKLKTDELQEHKDKMQVNEKIIMELNSENVRLKKNIEIGEEEQMKKYADIFSTNLQELQNLRAAVLEKDITIESVQTRNTEIENENKQLYEFKTKYQRCIQELAECQNEIQRLTEGLNNRDQIIRRLEEMARRTSLSGSSSPADDKDQEIHHLQEYLKEKDKVIRQMSDDSKSLHRALETIQSKMKESGNVIELRKKLKEERSVNEELREMVERLENELQSLKEAIAQRSQDDTDIEDMVQRELNLSARLDRQIMNAIESEPENRIRREVESYVGNYSLNEKPDAGRYMDVKRKLKQSEKVNEELRKLKDDLEVEKEVLKCQVSEYEDRILQIKAELGEESKKVAKLDEALASERNMVRSLKIQMEREQRSNQSGHLEDSELIESLQAKLTSSMEIEKKLRNELSLLRQEHMNLEKQFISMTEEIQSQKQDVSPGLADLLEIEQQKYITLVEKFENEQRTNAELRNNVKRLEAEKNRYEKQLEITIEEKEELISSLALIEGVKEHLETDLKRTKEDLKSKEEECEWLQKRIKTMTDAETRRQEQRTTEQNQLKALRREINNAREVMTDLEADMKQSKIELRESAEREFKLTQTLESLRARETELRDKLEVAHNEEKRMQEIIADLQEELKASIKREVDLTKDLEDRFSREKNVPTKFVQKMKELNDTNKKFASEKSMLHEEVLKLRDEREQLSSCIRALENQMKQNIGVPTVNTNRTDSRVENIDIEKLQHFYGKYLRVESRRKALQYQKRYLLCIVGGYQLSEQNTISVLAQLTRKQRSYTRKSRNRKNPRARFRSVVLVMVSIHRMKWLIMRWRTGKRVGANAILGSVDQPCVPVKRPAANHSPPVRERGAAMGDVGLTGSAFEQYYQRLCNIQQTLGLAMEPGSSHIISE